MSRKRSIVDELEPPRPVRSSFQVEQTFQRSVVKALSERLCVIQAKHTPADDAARRRVFAMLGSTGNVYHVTISCDTVRRGRKRSPACIRKSVYSKNDAILMLLLS
jgi:hypothetical protein